MAKTLAELLLAAVIAVAAVTALFIAFDIDGRSQSGPPRHRPIAPTGQAAKTETPGDQEHFLTTPDGRERRYLVHRPKNPGPSGPLPVVLAFHGATGRAESLREQSRLDDVADRQGFLLVYPEGNGVSRLLTFNAGSCCGEAFRQRIDDVGFVRQLLSELPHHYAVDPRRVYATGFDNGAMFCYRLACELADRIAAIAPVAGDLEVDGPQPSRPVPVMHFHGTDDPICPFEGGKGKNPFEPVRHRSIPDTIAWWVWANHCRSKPVAVQEAKDYTRTRYEPAPGLKGAPVILYTLPGGGHTWPGGIDITAHLATGNLVPSVDASTIMWQFFAQCSLPNESRPQ